MVSLAALWLPILLSTVAVFLASWVVHMLLKYHQADYQKLPDEEKIRAALREAKVPPGNYHFPRPDDPKQMYSEEMLEKYKQGPNGLLNVIPAGPVNMGKYLLQWFIFCLVVAIFVAYLAGRVLGPGAEYLAVFRVTGTTCFLAYAGGQVTDSIWKGQKWGTTIRHTIDSLIYALLTAGFFGWLWPS